MSIDIDWEALTTGPDGLALAESIRVFIHDKFQQVALPRFIKSVEVHSFDFGKQCPVIELKDVCDPLQDFYDGNDEDEEEHEGREPPEDEVERQDDQAIGVGGVRPEESLRDRRKVTRYNELNGAALISGTQPKPPSIIDARPNLRSNGSLADQIAGPLLSRSGTPGIPGGTSNLSYFHLPLSAGLSGSQTPLAAVAGGTPYQANWQDFHAPPWEHHPRCNFPRERQHYVSQDHTYADPSTRPSTATSYAPQHGGFTRQDSIDGTADQSDSQTQRHEPDPSDLQIVLHISYSGDIRLSLTVEILLDYPMPSFVGIPLKLNITGLSFDGVALIAYLKKRAQFCFLGEENAVTLVGAENALDDSGHGEDTKAMDRNQHGDKLGGLLREIKVESEIGQKEGGKQVLKNVGKVEKFVLEQVRRIFEEEFVYPSFWTFLV